MTVSLSDTTHELAESEVLAFGASLRGDLVKPNDPDYGRVRSIWNGMIDRRPALIARCRGVADVITAVNFGRSHDLLVSVRGGGHNVSGNALCEGGLMIDMSLMASVHVDLQRGIVRAEAGTLLGELDRETQAFGLAVPAGTVSETGIAGLTLGGGLGWLMRKHGLTCDNLIGVDIVTADGEFLQANDDTNPELMWGIRGGGGNFGIVTSFEYQAVPVGPTVLAGTVLHPIERAREFFEFYSYYTKNVPDELTTIGTIRTMSPVPSVPIELRGVRVVGTAVCYSGDIEEGEKVVQPLRQFGTPLLDSIGPTSFVEHQAIFDQGVPAGRHYYEKSEYLSDLSPDLVSVLVEHAVTVTSPYAFIGLFQLGGAIGRIGEQDTAYTHRDASYSLIISAAWDNAHETDQHIEWARTFWKAAKPFSTGGAYINFMSADDGQDRVIAAYGPDKYQRLVRLKNTYDPNNLFRLNQNIKPTVSTADSVTASWSGD